MSLRQESVAGDGYSPAMKIEDFANASRSGAWSDYDIGFSMDVDAAAYWDKDRFKLLSAPRAEGEPAVFRLDWIGEGTTLSDVQRDFYRLYGRFAEEAQFISQTVGPAEVTFDVLVGTPEHGHRAEFVVTGPRVAVVASGYLKLREENRRRSPGR